MVDQDAREMQALRDNQATREQTQEERDAAHLLHQEVTLAVAIRGLIGRCRALEREIAVQRRSETMAGGYGPERMQRDFLIADLNAEERTLHLNMELLKLIVAQAQKAVQ